MISFYDYLERLTGNFDIKGDYATDIFNDDTNNIDVPKQKGLYNFLLEHYKDDVKLYILKDIYNDYRQKYYRKYRVERL
jgi:hypothetical protein